MAGHSKRRFLHLVKATVVDGLIPAFGLLRQPVELPRAQERVRIGAGGRGDVGEVAIDAWRSLQNVGRVGPAQDDFAPGPDDANPQLVCTEAPSLGFFKQERTISPIQACHL
jgi:hypothetical protein